VTYTSLSMRANGFGLPGRLIISISGRFERVNHALRGIADSSFCSLWTRAIVGDLKPVFRVQDFYGPPLGRRHRDRSALECATEPGPTSSGRTASLDTDPSRTEFWFVLIFFCHLFYLQLRTAANDFSIILPSRDYAGCFVSWHYPNQFCRNTYEVECNSVPDAQNY